MKSGGFKSDRHQISAMKSMNSRSIFTNHLMGVSMKAFSCPRGPGNDLGVMKEAGPSHLVSALCFCRIWLAVEAGLERLTWDFSALIGECNTYLAQALRRNSRRPSKLVNWSGCHDRAEDAELPVFEGLTPRYNTILRKAFGGVLRVVPPQDGPRSVEWFRSWRWRSGPRAGALAGEKSPLPFEGLDYRYARPAATCPSRLTMCWAIVLRIPVACRIES
jgi:hypothetical protein